MKDQLNRKIVIDTIPFRIVSIVPSQTELLFDLGLRDEVVGITKFCIHPTNWHKNKVRVGGTKKINFKIVRELAPDIIFANKEENTKDDIIQLEAICPVWVSDIRTFACALDMILSIGDIVGKKIVAVALVQQLKQLQCNFQLKNSKKLSTIYFIWKNPYMVAGCDTFIHEMMSMAGFQNVIDSNRYPILNVKEIQILKPDLILLSSEPYPFGAKDMNELTILLPNSKILLVDGELFSWYGSRLLKSFDYFSALHEQIH